MDLEHSYSEEDIRLSQLRSYEIMDTPPEISFDQFTFMAASLCQTPIALLSFIDNKRQWFKSNYGLEIQELPREVSACNQTITTSNPFVIEDTLDSDDHFSSFMIKKGYRFYAGVPITSRNGYHIGALCVMDYKPRKISKEQLKGLTVLSDQIIDILEIRKSYVHTLEYLKKVNENFYKNDKDAQSIAHRAAMKAMTELSSGLSYRIKPLLLSLNKELSEDLKAYQFLVRKNNKLILDTLESLERFIVAEKEKGMKPLDLGSTIQGVIQHQEWKLKKSNIDLTSDIEKDVIVIANSSQIIQIILSIVENAIEAQLRRGEKKIHVEMKSHNHIATISISDYGEGIEEENKSFVFFPFFTTKSSHHQGIGLALAQALVRKHSGEIYLKNRNHPTVFEIKLPVP